MACICLDFYQVCYPQWFLSMQMFNVPLAYFDAKHLLANIQTHEYFKIPSLPPPSLQFKYSKNQSEITVSSMKCVQFQVAILWNGKSYFSIVQIAQHILGQNIKRMEATFLTGRRKEEHCKTRRQINELKCMTFFLNNLEKKYIKNGEEERNNREILETDGFQSKFAELHQTASTINKKIPLLL